MSRRYLPAILLAVLAAACGDTGSVLGSGQLGGDACASNSDCSEGEICKNGACEPAADTCEGGDCDTGEECSSDDDCASGEECTGGICVDRAECEDDSDCGGEEACRDGECRGGSSTGSGDGEGAEGVPDSADSGVTEGEEGGAVEGPEGIGPEEGLEGTEGLEGGETPDAGEGLEGSEVPDAGEGLEGAETPDAGEGEEGSTIKPGGPCTSDAQCLEGQFCITGKCVDRTPCMPVPGPAPGPDPAGDAGTGDDDGGTGDGGSAAADAGTPGPVDDGCTGPAVCTNGFCEYPACTGSNDACPGGWTCNHAKCIPPSAPVCTPGEVNCAGADALHCEDNGYTVRAETCDTVAGEFCAFGSGCVVCIPGEKSCDGNNLLECSPDGKSKTLLQECSDAKGEFCKNGGCDSYCAQAAKTRSSVGCEYWAVDLDNYTGSAQEPSADEQQFAVVVSNIDLKLVAEVKVHVREQDGSLKEIATATIGPKSLHTFKLNERREVNLSAFAARNAYRVTSQIPVIAYQFNPLDNVGVFSNDATLLLPTSGLDNRYYVVAPPNVNADLAGLVQVVAVEDDTPVEITAKAPLKAGGGLPGVAAGASHKQTINAFDVIQFAADGGENTDISGTLVVAEKPVAVFGSHVCSNVPIGSPYCDHVEMQMIPISAWGKEFVAAKGPIRNDLSKAPKKAEDDYYKFIAGADGTVITLTPGSGGTGTQTINLNAGEFKALARNDNFTVSATHPIMIGQFMSGSTTTNVGGTDCGCAPFDFLCLIQCTGNDRSGGGDPAFSLVVPIEQYLPTYVVLAPDKYKHDWLILSGPQAAKITIDGQKSTTFGCTNETIPGNLHKALRCKIADGVHTIDSDLPVGATIWGLDQDVSYGYPGGMWLRQINNDF